MQYVRLNLCSLLGPSDHQTVRSVIRREVATSGYPSPITPDFAFWDLPPSAKVKCMGGRSEPHVRVIRVKSGSCVRKANKSSTLPSSREASREAYETARDSCRTSANAAPTPWLAWLASAEPPAYPQDEHPQQPNERSQFWRASSVSADNVGSRLDLSSIEHLPTEIGQTPER